jgi:hypothetical protein
VTNSEIPLQNLKFQDELLVGLQQKSGDHGNRNILKIRLLLGLP